MKEKTKEPLIIPSMHDTIRQEINAALREGPCSARELSAAAGIPEREMPAHLEHVRKNARP
jgi:DNA-binding transcriptional ArsR family regulator